MCHSCVSRNPGSFGLATLFLLGKGELWIPAFAGMTIQRALPGLAFGQAGLSRQERGDLLDSAK